MSKLTRFICHSMVIICCATLLLTVGSAWADPVIIDHRHTDITQIPQTAIEQAKTNLHIAYGHTSHGSQLTSGMTGLVAFANAGGLGLSLPTDIFEWNNGGNNGALDFHDQAMAGDVGYYPQWENNTRTYLDNPANADVNVIIWSWCGQASDYTEQEMIDRYLAPMAQLEQDYPDVTFVYMTGHLDGGGETGNLNQRNQQIRNFCTTNEKALYDFADIESYDPDGLINYMVLDANDACAYDSDGNGSRDQNWAINWQNSHTQGLDWYSCESAHSQALNANRKAYAAWWLWATLAGWNPSEANRAPTLNPIGDQEVTCEQLLSFTVTATDLDSTASLTYSATPLPNGAAFDANQGTFTWTPSTSDEGDYQITFSVTDGGSPQGSDQETVTISVVAPGSTPGNESSNDSGGGGCFIFSIL
jgi:hypothetical protein